MSLKAEDDTTTLLYFVCYVANELQFTLASSL